MNTVLLATLACVAAAGEFEKQASSWNESVTKDARGGAISTSNWSGAAAQSLHSKIAAQPPEELSLAEAQFLANRANARLVDDAAQDAIIESVLRKMAGATNAFVARAARAPLCARFATRAEVDAWLPSLLPPQSFNAAWAAAKRLADDTLWDGFCAANKATGFAGPAYQSWFRSHLGALPAAESRRALIQEIRGLVRGQIELTPAAQDWLHELRLKLAVADELKDLSQ